MSDSDTHVCTKPLRVAVFVHFSKPCTLSDTIDIEVGDTVDVRAIDDSERYDVYAYQRHARCRDEYASDPAYDSCGFYLTSEMLVAHFDPISNDRR